MRTLVCTCDECPLFLPSDAGAPGESGRFGINFEALESVDGLNGATAPEDHCFTER